MKLRTACLFLFFVGVMLFPTWAVLAQGIENPDFEGDTGWSFFNNGENWIGNYSSEWSSHGTRSYEIHIPPVGQHCENYPGANTYGEAFQVVDLSGVKALKFGLKTFGSWDIPALGPHYCHSAEVWIDDTRVYYRERAVGEFHNQLVPIHGFSGTHRIAFRMQGHADFCSTVDRGMYIDNIRTVDVLVSLYLPCIVKSSHAQRNLQ